MNARAQFVPVALTPDSYNQDMVMEKSGPTPVMPGGYTTASMDGGIANNGDTWMEIGYFTDFPTEGLPAPGTTFTSQSDPTHSFAMAPDYRANNAVMLDASTNFPSATLTLKTPTAFGALSFLTSGGNGGCIFRYTVHHQDGTSETATLPSADWFNGANPAYTANGRVNAQTYTADNIDSDNPRLYGKDATLTNGSSPITSIDLAYVSSAAGAHTCIMAVSGAPSATGTFVPIPVTGYNADIVVEAAAPKTQAITGVTTATMDAGTANTGATWYEQGYVTNALSTGLPAAGSTVTNSAAADHTYKLAADYAANNAILLETGGSATATFATPQSFAGLSILGASGSGNTGLSYDVTHQDGTTESGTTTIKDWFNNTPVAFTAGGRVNLDTSVLDSVGTENPRLYAADIALTNSSPVTAITFTYVDAGTGSRAVIFAISGGSGVVPPVFSSDPAAVKISPGDTATLTAVAGGTPPITYQWQHSINGTFENVANGGNISGATTATLTITAATEAQGGDYRLIATNTGGSSTSAAAKLTVLSALTSVTTPGDPTAIVNNSTPAAETVDHVIDQTTQKYLNFDADSAAPFVGPVGFTVSPSMGRTIVTVLRFYTANDAPERDPADYTLEGSNDGATWTAISSGPLSLPTDRNAAGVALDPVTQAIEQVTFQNTKAYTSYRVTFNHVRDETAANSMQIGEVEFLGVADNSGTPFFTTAPASVRAFENGSAQFIAAASGTPAPSIQWFRSVNGTATALSNGGNISGADTGTLTVNNAGAADATGYFAVASNTAGSVTSSIVNLTLVSSLQDVTSASDPITGFGDQSGTAWGDSTNSFYAIDDSTTKYVNGGSGFSAAAGFPPFQGPVGVVVTPAAGSTIVRGLRIYTAEANPERDPADYKLEGSNDGATFSTISSGSLSLPIARNATGLSLDPLMNAMQEVLFSNGAAYTTYRLTFTNVRDNTAASAMQIAEFELLGGQGTSGPSVSITKGSGGNLTITSTQAGTLQSTTQLLNTGTVWTSEGPINGSVTVQATGTMKFYRVAP
jgi:hypothetical protein